MKPIGTGHHLKLSSESLMCICIFYYLFLETKLIKNISFIYHIYIYLYYIVIYYIGNITKMVFLEVYYTKQFMNKLYIAIRFLLNCVYYIRTKKHNKIICKLFAYISKIVFI